jgi:magnesium chelatase family protein
MRAAMSQLNLSAKVYYRILKLADTIADLVGSEDIHSMHLAESLRYRSKLILSWGDSCLGEVADLRQAEFYKIR